MKGRSATSPPLQVLEGKKVIRLAHPRPTRPEMPAGMSPVARREWRRLAGELYANKLLTGWDVALFVAYCEAVATRAATAKVVTEEGHTYTNSRGDVRVRPEVRVMQAANDQIRLMGERFALDPLAR